MLTALSFTKRYVLALGIIALLSTLAYFNLNHMIESQVDDGKMINISGRQRMLSQKIALFSIYYKTKYLFENIKLMEHSHRLLVSSKMSDELKKLYFEEPVHLDKRVKEYLFHAKRFYENHDGRSLNYVLKHSQSLLYDLDRAVSIYQKEAEIKTKKLKKVEFFIFVLTLITLFFEAIFIFMPANRSINKKTKELTAEKDYSNMIIESSANAIIALDKDRKVQTYNKMAEKIFGYTKEEMIGEDSLKKIIPKKYRRLHDLGLSNFMKSGKLKHRGEVLELEGLRKDNKVFPIRIYFGKTSDKENVSIVANIQDISKEKLKDTIVQQQAKFAALGEMIAIIAHQWRQPLAQLNFNCMYIRKKLKDDELKKEISKNEEIIAFMSETISSFEDFYKKSKREIFHPEKSIAQALKLLESLFKLNQIELVKDFRSGATVYGSINSLAQVVLSILQNMIDVIKQREIQNPVIKIVLKERSDEEVELTIADNAGGIIVKPIEEIFEPFKSKKTVPSTGIGLYMSRLIIEEKFKGCITARNIDEGAMFTIILPKTKVLPD
ncbi:PAS domain-containing sensor histidine kinase [Hydrogenimonas cancrithermarum]|uniref:histidine kinase n=1 Tax=Hydrogenimonas cancrithermarum TaxID=2993563 RepID=A0ABM8FM17_9BACT|nr:PAS domain S-box protein [Hydrogenimonas cancrithermarum]BDY12440.1 hypothetical protein HCR_07520 [Hydrogenimonas cancrithermarum]